MPQSTIAIVGNPNCGKTALFNQLSGLRQRTGNFAGVTVEKKSTVLRLNDQRINLVDLPGTYSLYPLTEDEHVVAKTLIDVDSDGHPDAVLFIADPNHLERHMLLYTQIRDLGFPIILGLSMSDIARSKGLVIDLPRLQGILGHPVVSFSARTGEGLDQLRDEILKLSSSNHSSTPIYELNDLEKQVISVCRTDYSDYQKLITVHHVEQFDFVPEDLKADIILKKEKLGFDNLAAQVEETLSRFGWIEGVLHKVLKNEKDYLDSKSLKADRILTHKVVGPIIFFFVLFLIFQAIYSLAEAPMEWIESVFAISSEWFDNMLPDNMFKSLLTEGILPGLAGVLVFIPQIAILFFLLGLLEESGYLSRPIFLFDRFFQRLGMNGRSLVALVSASACAIPAIMSTRSIRSKKERLLTILVTPLVSCSARTPVYIVLVGFIVSNEKVWGFINLQGLAFLGFYLLGILAVILFSLLLKVILKSREPSFLMLELPEYKVPSIKDIGYSTWLKVRSFIVEAGKIIFIISIALWFLSSYGPSNRDQVVQERLESWESDKEASEEEVLAKAASLRLETSYAGRLGHAIEPVIAPLGFDWKIGISLITSFAAREVFVSTMATIYSLESEENTTGIRQRMSEEVNPVTGAKRYTSATALSLVVFYIFAMQCMSTLAVVKKETGSWKWPVLQFVSMTALAYLSSLFVYQILS